MISPVRHSASLFAVALLLAVAGCQQQAGDAPASNSAANNSNESDNLHEDNLREIVLAVTGMT